MSNIAQYYKKRMIIASISDKKYHFSLYNFEWPKIIRIFDRMYTQESDMTNFEIIKCHGSGNDFIMVDTTRMDNAAAIDWSAFARIACNRTHGIGSDGVLLVVRNNEGIYGMDMLNPDGTHAEMCGPYIALPRPPFGSGCTSGFPLHIPQGAEKIRHLRHLQDLIQRLTAIIAQIRPQGR